MQQTESISMSVEEGLKVTIKIEADDLSHESPDDWDGQWKLVSFNSNHRGHEDYSRYLTGVDDYGEAVPANIGLYSKLKHGTAFMLSYFEHGSGRWSIKGSGPQCRWDTTQIAGILLWNHPPGDMGKNKKYAEREADAGRFLEMYNDWMNGYGYWYSIESNDDEINDSCGGFYMSDEKYMLSNIRDVLVPYLIKHFDEAIEIEVETEYSIDIDDILNSKAS